MSPQVGDRVVYHGDNKRWKGVAGRVRHVIPEAHAALVVPDSGLPPGFDIRWSFIDIHLEKRALDDSPSLDAQCCPTCGQLLPSA